MESVTTILEKLPQLNDNFAITMLLAPIWAVAFYAYIQHVRSVSRRAKLRSKSRRTRDW